jgi:hypothetical protein
MTTSSAQLEARVLELIDAVLSGNRIEDDLVECKRRWPGVEKARQLAGSANSARGDPLLWIVGLDEDAHQTVPVGDQDPAQWASQVSARFDQDIAPVLLQHLRVPVGDGKAVIALLFSTDRAPYVVKTAGGSPEREVPIRDGTRTRSARRDELIRILTAAVLTPAALVLDAEVNYLTTVPASPAAQQPFPPTTVERPARMHEPKDAATSGISQILMYGSISFFLEHRGDEVLVAPAHEMSAILTLGHYQISMKAVTATTRASKIPRWGVYGYEDNLICTASGSTSLNLSAQAPFRARAYMSSVEEALLSVTLGFAGAPRPVHLNANLVRTALDGPSQQHGSNSAGRWKMHHDKKR